MLILYLEGLGFRSIARSLEFSNVTVFKYIKVFGEKLYKIRYSGDIEVVKINEMHTYIGKKNLCLDMDCC